ncbi:hypothetical protein BM221_005762 [Beauveria bassiana]|uniref:Uncharacterized protein n=1 Tax=Beauveria bassiana TaxID=176275 RepID=A0A2N6NPK7_BEABA|nr:hypothetical protein BM221_005762 [Beauveria bassiana]
MAMRWVLGAEITREILNCIAPIKARGVVLSTLDKEESAAVDELKPTDKKRKGQAEAATSA